MKRMLAALCIVAALAVALLIAPELTRFERTLEFDENGVAWIRPAESAPDALLFLFSRVKLDCRGLPPDGEKDIFFELCAADETGAVISVGDRHEAHKFGLSADGGRHFAIPPGFGPDRLQIKITGGSPAIESVAVTIKLKY